MADSEDTSPDLPLPWQRIQSAIWLIGLAILAWQGWWWPGILILVAVSGITQAVIQMYVGQRQEQATIQKQRNQYLPENCPNCGVPIAPTTVKWTGPTAAVCPYCGSQIKVLDRSQAEKQD